MSPKSNNHSHGPPTPPSADIDVDDTELTKEFFDKVMVLDKCMFDFGEDDIEQHVPFNSSCYPDSEHGSMYMSSPSTFPSRTKTHD